MKLSGGQRKIRGRAGWTRIRGGCGGIWKHDASGWVVQHCGHPTAHWPYVGIPPGPQDQILIATNGKAFQHLKLAQMHVEGVLVGAVRTRSDGWHPKYRTTILVCLDRLEE